MSDRSVARLAVLMEHMKPTTEAAQTQGISAAAVSAQSAESHNGRFVARALQLGDYRKGFYDVLSQLTSVGDVNEAKFTVRFQEISAMSDTYFVRVIEDTTTGRVVAMATLIVEKKFTHNNGVIGHIEDVVVDKEMRGHDLGRKIIQELMKIGDAAGCYKVILDCAEKNIGFYEKCDFKHKGDVCMAWYIDGRS